MTKAHFDLSRSIVDYLPATRRRLTSILGMLRPYDCCGLTKKRLGRSFDGGYVMIDDFEGLVAAYSFGINDDVSWDIDVANQGVDIYQYDHTIDKLPAHHPRFKWRKVGLSSVSDEGLLVETLEQLMLDNGHENTLDLVLKCDIEGHEWDVLSDLPVLLLRRFRQIVVEVHALQEIASGDHAEIIRRAVTNLTSNHHVVHVHANNWSHWAILGSTPLPTVLELTLLRKDRGVFMPASTQFPTELDMPNNPDRPDFPLGSFRF